MALLSRKADYALMILSYLDCQKEGASAREVAAQYGLSKAFTANILKLLCHKGFVASHRGVKGGYLLQRPTTEVPLLELLDAIDEPTHLAECNRNDGIDACSLVDVCPLKHAMAEVHERIREVLRTVTLAQLFRPASAGGATQFGLNIGAILDKQLVAP
jgi:Rrf2 family protein